MKIKNIILLVSFLYSHPLFVIPPVPANKGIGDVNLSTEIPTDYAPPPRDIMVFLDSGKSIKQESATGALIASIEEPFKPFKTNQAITYKFRTSLFSSSPILVSPTILMNLVTRQIILKDLKNLSTDQMVEKYSTYTNKNPKTIYFSKFSNPDVINFYKNIFNKLNPLREDLITRFKTFSESPNNAHLTLLNISRINYNQAIDDFDKNPDPNMQLVTNEIINQLFYYKEALDLNKWEIGKTKDGAYLLLPKDEHGVLLPTGLNYKNIDGFNGIEVPNLFDSFNQNINETLKNNFQSSTSDTALSLLDLLKITSQESAQANIFLTGHGSPKTDLSNGLIANIDIKFFNENIVSILDTLNLKILMNSSCFNADINAQSAYQTENESLGTHSFTIILNGIIFSPTYNLISDAIIETIKTITEEQRQLKKNNNLSTKQELEQQYESKINRFNNYLENLKIDIYKASADFSMQNNTDNSITSLITTPSVKLATTNYWIRTADEFKNVLQISNIQSSVNAADRKSFMYNLEGEGGLLLSTETILAPIVIEIGDELPYIIPISTGEKIHYIKKISIEDPSITVDFFITKSIKPFIDQMNEVDIKINKAKKTIVIGELNIKEGTAKAVITGEYALYTINSNNNSANENNLKIISFTKDNKNLWENIANFNETLIKAHEQETKVQLYIEGIEKISTTIHDRQEKLRFIQKIIGDSNWYEYSKTNDLSNKDAIFDAIINAIKTEDNNPLTEEFFSYLSPHELIIINYVLNTNTLNNEIDSNTLKTALEETLSNAKKILNKKEITINEKFSNDIHTELNFYGILSLDDQAIMKNDFKACLEDNIQSLLDPNTLTAKEQFLVENYLKTTLSLTIDQDQKNDLNAKITAVTASRDETTFNKYLKDRYNALIMSVNKSLFIDWVANLSQTERQSINLDILAFFTKEAYNDPNFSNYQLTTLNITELFTLKTNIEKFFNSSGVDQATILDKASTLYGNKITMDDFATRLTSSLQSINQRVINSFSAINNDRQVLLIMPNSIDTYAQIFKRLSFEEQKEIVDNLEALKTAPQDFLKYQQSLVDDRIKTATSFDDLVALKTDITNTKNLILTHQQSTTLDAKFHQAQDTYNRSTHEKIPIIPNAGSTGNSIFYPPTIDQQGQPVIILPDPKNPNNPTDPTKHEITPGQLIPDNTQELDDPKLQEDKERLEKEQKDQEDNAKTARDNNQAAQDEAKRRGETGNHEPVVFEI